MIIGRTCGADAASLDRVAKLGGIAKAWMITHARGFDVDKSTAAKLHPTDCVGAW